jgi:CheY-like chemotaxis protein
MVRIDFTRLRFLIVDDNAHMRRLVRTMLYAFGARSIIEAENGEIALDLVSRQVPDIVIADWVMPKIDGIEFTTRLRRSDLAPYVPVVLLTGHTERRRVLAARDAGVTEFLAKPISARGLYQCILNVVANPRQFIQSSTYFGPDRRRSASTGYTGPDRRSGARADTFRPQSLLEKARAD